jgi:hypothetical protein
MVDIVIRPYRNDSSSSFTPNLRSVSPPWRRGINSDRPKDRFQRSVDGGIEPSTVERPVERVVGSVRDRELLKGKVLMLRIYRCQIYGALNNRFKPSGRGRLKASNDGAIG